MPACRIEHKHCARSKVRQGGKFTCQPDVPRNGAYLGAAFSASNAFISRAASDGFPNYSIDPGQRKMSPLREFRILLQSQKPMQILLGGQRIPFQCLGFTQRVQSLRHLGQQSKGRQAGPRHCSAQRSKT